RARIARPVADASGRSVARLPGGARRGSTRGRAGRQREDPPFLPGVTVERDYAVAGGDVHRPVDHDRHRGVERAERIAPRLRQLSYVVAVDVGEGGVPRRLGIAVDRAPVALRDRVLRDRGGACSDQQSCREPEAPCDPHGIPSRQVDGPSACNGRATSFVDYVLRADAAFDNGQTCLGWSLFVAFCIGSYASERRFRGDPLPRPATTRTESTGIPSGGLGGRPWGR